MKWQLVYTEVNCKKIIIISYEYLNNIFFDYFLSKNHKILFTLTFHHNYFIKNYSVLNLSKACKFWHTEYNSLLSNLLLLNANRINKKARYNITQNIL